MPHLKFWNWQLCYGSLEKRQRQLYKRVIWAIHKILGWTNLKQNTCMNILFNCSRDIFACCSWEKKQTISQAATSLLPRASDCLFLCCTAMDLLIATLCMFCQHSFWPLGFPQTVPSCEVKVHIWKIFLLFQVRALETNWYGKSKAKKALTGVWNSQETLGN